MTVLILDIKKLSKRMSAFQNKGNNSENHRYLCWKLQAVSMTVFLGSSSKPVSKHRDPLFLEENFIWIKTYSYLEDWRIGLKFQTSH